MTLSSLLVECDSYVSLCRARHPNPDDVKREMDDLIARLRRLSPPEAEPEPRRINRVMREVLTEHLSQLNREAREKGWS